MGQIICPNGISVINDKISGTIFYEDIIRNIQSDCFTNTYRTKCILLLKEIGFFSYKDELFRYLHWLKNETESDELADACRKVTRKKKKK